MIVAGSAARAVGWSARPLRLARAAPAARSARHDPGTDGYRHTMTDRAPADTEARAGADPGAGPGTGAPGGIVVRVPGPLRSLVDGAAEVEVPAGTVAGALETLVLRHPGLRRHLLADDGAVRDYVNVFRNDDDVRYLEGVATPVRPGDTLTIVPSIAGG